MAGFGRWLGFGWWSIGRLQFDGGDGVGASLINGESSDPFVVEEALRCATVLTCLQILSQGIGEVTFEAPDDKNLDDVLKDPNDWQTPTDFWQAVTIDVMCYGSAKVRIGLDRNGRVNRLAPYASSELKVQATKEGMPIFLDRKTGEQIPSREIVYIRDQGFSFINGISRLESAWTRIKALNSADALIDDVFENGVSANNMLRSKGKITAEKKMVWDEELKKMFGVRGRKRGGVVFLDNDATLERAPMLKPADADLRDLRVNLIREVSSVFGIPAFLTGGNENMAYSNTSARLAALYRQVFSPMVRAYVEALQKRFRTEVKADPTKLLMGDLQSLTRDAKELKLAGIITPNEARERVGMDRHDGDDADKLMCSAGAMNDRGDRSGEFPTDDGTMGNPTPNDRSATDLRVVK